MQITKDHKEPVAGDAQVGLHSWNEFGLIEEGMISPLQTGSLLNHVGSCGPM